jgi:hypothetical protein
MITGLPFDNISFGVLPPLFPTDIVEKIDNMFWINVIGGYENYPTGMKSALPFFLASLIYHENSYETHWIVCTQSSDPECLLTMCC